MSYESIMAFNRRVIVTIGNEIKVFLNADDANHYFMNCNAMEHEEREYVAECLDYAYADRSTIYWCNTSIEAISDEIFNNDQRWMYYDLKVVLKQAIAVIMDDEKERVLREGK